MYFSIIYEFIFIELCAGWSTLSRRLSVGRSILSYYDQTFSPFRIAFKILISLFFILRWISHIHIFLVNTKVVKKYENSKFICDYFYGGNKLYSIESLI